MPALPLVLITVWEALVNRGAIEARHRVLIHAGAGGVGHIAIQLARFLRAKVATTVSSSEKAKFAQSLGAERVIDYTQEEFVAAAKAWTDGEGVDIVLDSVGGETFLRSFEAVRIFGRIITLLATPIDMGHANKARVRNLLIGYEGMAAPMALGNHRDPWFQLERRARGRHGGYAPLRVDNDGQSASALAFDLGDDLESALDLDALAEVLRAAGAIDVRVSEDAGGYVCELTHHVVLTEGRRLGVPALFLHCPPVEVLSAAGLTPLVGALARALVTAT